MLRLGWLFDARMVRFRRHGHEVPASIDFFFQDVFFFHRFSVVLVFELETTLGSQVLMVGFYYCRFARSLIRINVTFAVRLL